MTADDIRFLLQPWLRGYGQVIFMPHSAVGAALLLAVAMNAPKMALGAVLGGLIASIAGWFVGTLEDYSDGLFGFNGALIGIATVMFFEPTTAIWYWIAIMAAFSAWLMAQARRHRLTIMTAPFISITLLAFVVLPLREQSEQGMQLIAHHQPLFSGLTAGVGQMAFQSSILSAAVIVLALLAIKWQVALVAIAGSAAGVLVAQLAAVPDDIIASGVMSFNTALSAAAVYQLFEQRPPIFISIAAVLLSAVLTLVAYWLGLVVLTSPFVLSIWWLMLMDRIRLQNSTNTAQQS